MKKGDIVRYKYPKVKPGGDVGLILYVNVDGGTLKVLDKLGQVDWFVTSYCEVISESR